MSHGTFPFLWHVIEVLFMLYFLLDLRGLVQQNVNFVTLCVSAYVRSCIPLCLCVCVCVCACVRACLRVTQGSGRLPGRGE